MRRLRAWRSAASWKVRRHGGAVRLAGGPLSTKVDGSAGRVAAHADGSVATPLTPVQLSDRGMAITRGH
jgi:hypothetical protein